MARRIATILVTIFATDDPPVMTAEQSKRKVSIQEADDLNAARADFNVTEAQECADQLDIVEAAIRAVAPDAEIKMTDNWRGRRRLAPTKGA